MERANDSDRREITIAILPPEILALILLEYIRDYRQSYESSPCDSSHEYTPYGWVKISQVCSTWRSCVFTTPQLWTTIYLSREEYINAALLYSGQLPLTVKPTRFEVWLPIDMVARMLRPLHRHVHRLYDVTLPGFYGMNPFDEPNEDQERVAANLESLTISVSSRNLPQSVPLFAQLSFPHLSNLSLDGMGGRWHIVKHFAVSTVTRLSLQNGQAGPDLPSLLHLLQDLPSLTELDIHNPSGCIPAFIQPPQAPTAFPDPVSLPKLQLLIFSEEIHLLADAKTAILLMHLRVPVSCRFMFHLQCDELDIPLSNTAGAVALQLSQLGLQRDDISSFRSCTLSHLAAHQEPGSNRWSKLQFSLWLHELDVKASFERSPPQICFELIERTFVRFDDPQDCEEVVSSLVFEFLKPPLPFTSVTSLIISAPCDDRCWRALRRKMPNIVQLSIWSNISCQSFLRVLDYETQWLRESVSSSAVQDAFLKLRVLNLGSTDWSIPHSLGSLMTRPPESLTHKLIRVFRFRAVEARIQRLDLLVLKHARGLETADVEALRAAEIATVVELLHRDSTHTNELPSG